MRTDTLPNGFTRISGRKEPPADGPSAYYVILRNGMRPPDPWPVKGTRWKWGDKPDDFDVVAVKNA